MLPFIQRGFMKVPRLHRSVGYYSYLDGGDFHHSVCVQVLKVSTGYVAGTSDVTWASRPAAGGGGSDSFRVFPARNRDADGCRSAIPTPCTSTAAIHTPS